MKWAVEIDGQSAAFTELSQNKLPIRKAGIYKITAVSQKYNVISNVVELNVKPARKLSSVTIQTDLETNGIGIGSAYESDLKKDVTVTALDQYGDSYDWTKKTYQWLTGGKYSAVTADTLLGLVKGSDTLQLVVGEGEKHG